LALLFIFITEREPGGQIDLLCLRADGKPPSDEEYCSKKWPDDALYIRSCDLKTEKSATDVQGGRWEKKADAQALSGAYMASSGHPLQGPSIAQLTYALPGLRKAGRWQAWARVIMPDEFSNSFYCQLSADGGKTWTPSPLCEQGAIGWKVCKSYAWVPARETQRAPAGQSSPATCARRSSRTAALTSTPRPGDLRRSPLWGSSARCTPPGHRCLSF
jgi:hypothetical protein